MRQWGSLPRRLRHPSWRLKKSSEQVRCRIAERSHTCRNIRWSHRGTFQSNQNWKVWHEIFVETWKFGWEPWEVEGLWGTGGTELTFYKTFSGCFLCNLHPFRKQTGIGLDCLWNTVEVRIGSQKWELWNVETLWGNILWNPGRNIWKLCGKYLGNVMELGIIWRKEPFWYPGEVLKFCTMATRTKTTEEAFILKFEWRKLSFLSSAHTSPQ